MPNEDEMLKAGNWSADWSNKPDIKADLDAAIERILHPPKSTYAIEGNCVFRCRHCARMVAGQIEFFADAAIRVCLKCGNEEVNESIKAGVRQ